MNKIVFSPNSRQLASASDDKTIILWDMKTLQPIGVPLAGHTASIQALAFSPNGLRVASGSWDDTIRIWHVNSL